jgi:glyoxylase-like metal-dependent hydrolase (beta-lactamase superfamily II)
LGFAAWEGYPSRELPLPVEGDRENGLAERAKGMMVGSPAREVLPGVFASGGLEVVYYIRCGTRAVLVDTGFVHTFPAHLENFRNLGLDLSVIDAVLVCHFHVDHAAALADARRVLGAAVVAHVNNVPVLAAGDRVASAALVPFVGWDFPFQAYDIDYPVEDGDVVEVGEMAFHIVHLPGHTPGCTGYLFGDNWLLTGDVMLQGGILGWNDSHWGSNLYDIIDTMRRIADIKPSYCIPTHGVPWAYDYSTSEGGERRARALLDPFGPAGGILHTFRAPRAAVGRKARTIRPRRMG